MNYIEHWLHSVEDSKKAEIKQSKLLDRAERKAKLPNNIRPAEAKDIVEGAIIWYPENDNSDMYWMYVQEVLRPSDQWEAYCSHDGCRYGLYGAYVEIKE